MNMHRRAWPRVRWVLILAVLITGRVLATDSFGEVSLTNTGISVTVDAPGRITVVRYAKESIGYIAVVVIAGRWLMIEGFVMDKNSKEMGGGFIAGILSKGSEVAYLPKKEVFGRFSADYDVPEKYRGWDYSLTLYAHEADSKGMSRVLMTKTGTL